MLADHMADDVFAKVRDHLLRRFNGQLPLCPACRLSTWEFAGLTGAANFNLAEGRIGNVTTPLATLVCKNCFYVMNFAWKPIELGLTSLSAPPPGPGQ